LLAVAGDEVSAMTPDVNDDERPDRSRPPAPRPERLGNNGPVGNPEVSFPDPPAS